MKKFYLLAILLISLLGLSQVKADTTTIYLPVYEAVSLCVDINDMPVFVVHKPSGFGATMWYINGVYYNTGDSIVFQPANPGIFLVRSSSGGNIISAGLELFDTPPAGADFQISSGNAHFNTSKDTVWLCGESFQISSGPIPNLQDFELIGPNGESQTFLPMLITTSGWWTFTTSNPCGVVIDSFYVYKVETEVPEFEDLVFCNEDVDAILDAGPGWFSYEWKRNGVTISTNQSIHVTEAGDYSIDLWSPCDSTIVYVTVGHETYPLPDPIQYSINVSTSLCHDESATLIAHPSYSYDSYLWKRSGSIHSYNSTVTVSYPTDGNFTLEVTKGACVSSADQIITVGYAQDPLFVIMCVATYDIETGRNKIVFDNMSDINVEKYLLFYKTLNNSGDDIWEEINSVPYVEGQNIYTVFDTINDPNEQARYYKVLAQHVCGHTNDVWLYDVEEHGTIMVQKTGTVDGLAIQVVVPYYTNTGWAPNSYDIWVDEQNDGNLTKIGVLQVPIVGTPTFNVSNPIADASYYASVSLPWNCEESKNSLVVYSNRVVLNPVGIDFYQPNINIYPNPSNGIFHIEGVENISQVEIFDQLGRLVIKTTSNTIDLTSYNSGIYYTRITTANGPAVAKIVKN